MDEKAAESGFAPAQYALSRLYARELIPEPSPGESVKWLRLAAEQDYPKATYRLAMAFESGDGVTADREAGMSWLRRSADAGYVKAQYDLGNVVFCTTIQITPMETVCSGTNPPPSKATCAHNMHWLFV